jgi:hypothetical protein
MEFKKSKVCLAFDIERSGATGEYDTIGIGTYIVDHELKELDRLFCPGYFPDQTKFEPRCWDQFWSKNQDKLKKLEYSGTLDPKQRQKEMIEQFQEFRAKWEKYCGENNMELVLVSDNNVYDGGFINQMIFAHTNSLPIPYTASTQEYEVFYETHSMAKGVLLSCGIDKDWGLFGELEKIYDFPKYKVEHDHNCDNDAYTIANDYIFLRW